MLITEIRGNLHEQPLPEGIHVETITVPSAQLVKRIQRLRTDHGNEVGLRLPSGAPDLRDGDILALDDTNAVVIRVEASDVLVIRARTIHEMAVVAHTLGNRHLQAQFPGYFQRLAADRAGRTQNRNRFCHHFLLTASPD